MKSWITGSIRLEMSRFRSTFSRMRVELMSSRWGGSWSWMTLPVMGRSSGRGGLPRPAEDDVVHGVDGPVPGRVLVGGGVGHHVAARHQVHLLIGEQLPQALEVCGVGDVHRDLVGEQVHVEVPGDGQVDDLPADQVGLGLLWTRRTRPPPDRPRSPGPGWRGRYPCGTG